MQEVHRSSWWQDRGHDTVGRWNYVPNLAAKDKRPVARGDTSNHLAVLRMSLIDRSTQALEAGQKSGVKSVVK